MLTLINSRRLNATPSDLPAVQIETFHYLAGMPRVIARTVKIIKCEERYLLDDRGWSGCGRIERLNGMDMEMSANLEHPFPPSEIGFQDSDSHSRSCQRSSMESWLETQR